jgi:multidrug efflux pump subunit AcrA (membrane-fusion protein)
LAKEKLPARLFSFLTEQWLPIVSVAVVSTMALWYAYHSGEVAGGLNSAQVARERKNMTERLARLDAENSRLNARVAQLEMARRLDREAYSQVEQSIGEMQSKLARQNDDLVFYQSIVSPEDGIQGLRIQRLEIVPGPGPREYLFKLTLIQAMRHDTVVAGLAGIEIHGMAGAKPVSYSVGDLIGQPGAALPFSFRYFQTLEQAVTLPEGFEAFEARVSVRSRKLRNPIEQSFPWKVAGAGSL